MNPLLVIVPLVMFSLPAHVKEGDAKHLHASTGQQVFVIDADRREWQGRLLEVAKASMTIDAPDGARRFQLADIRRVDADGDSVRDGAIKGAAFGAFMGLIVAELTGSKSAILQSAIVYGLIGTGMDALNRCKQTVYRAPAPQVAISVTW